MIEKKYLVINVYEAFQKRIEFIFKEFDNIYISFSGGKDSGLLYSLVIKYMRENNITKKIGLFHQDFEAQYNLTTEYIERVFSYNKDIIDPYWVCLPLASKTPLSNSEPYFYPWDDNKKDLWCRDMPKHDYIINLENNPFDFYEYKMNQSEVYQKFGEWYHKKNGSKGKTIGLIGVRTDESLNRLRSITNKIHSYNDIKWTIKNYENVYTGSLLYDWSVDDVWVANYKFGFDYNNLYDLYYKAGLTPHQMRVASPFNEWAISSLNMYRIIDPKMWCKLVGRIQGANFGAIYGSTKAIGYKEVSLPVNHTWKSYVEFLLGTLPENIKNGYLEKFKTSIKFWKTVGGGLPDNCIEEIERCGYNIKRNGVSNFTKDKKTKIIFEEIPDHTDDVKSTNDIPSWKRMCFCIIKNDHDCKFMGFGLNKHQTEVLNEIKNKYKGV